MLFFFFMPSGRPVGISTNPSTTVNSTEDEVEINWEIIFTRRI